MVPIQALTTLDARTDDEWMSDSRCSDRRLDPDIWFNNVPLARMICSLCPVRDACLSHALERESRGDVLLGVWGGLSRIQRHRLWDRPTALPMMRKVRRVRPTLSLLDSENSEYNGEEHEDDGSLETHQIEQVGACDNYGYDEGCDGERCQPTHLEPQSNAVIEMTRRAGMASAMWP